jgi:hypothetical protein
MEIHHKDTIKESSQLKDGATTMQHKHTPEYYMNVPQRRMQQK